MTTASIFASVYRGALLVGLLSSLAAQSPAKAQNVNDYIDLFKGFTQSVTNKKAVSRAWAKLPSSERDCISQALRVQGGSLQALIRRGVSPDDPRLAEFRSECQLAPSVSTRISRDRPRRSRIYPESSWTNWDQEFIPASERDCIINFLILQGDYDAENRVKADRLKATDPRLSEIRPACQNNSLAWAKGEEPEEIFAQFLILSQGALRLEADRLALSYEYDPVKPCELSFTARITKLDKAAIEVRLKRSWDGTTQNVVPIAYKEVVNLVYLDPSRFEVGKIAFTPELHNKRKLYVAVHTAPEKWEQIPTEPLEPVEPAYPAIPNFPNENDVTCVLCTDEIRAEKLVELQDQWREDLEENPVVLEYRRALIEYKHDSEIYRQKIKDLKLNSFINNGIMGLNSNYTSITGNFNWNDFVPVLQKLIGKCVNQRNGN